jgi:tRNA U55 pseudouridine synthase TruB
MATERTPTVDEIAHWVIKNHVKDLGRKCGILAHMQSDENRHNYVLAMVRESFNLRLLTQVHFLLNPIDIAEEFEKMSMRLMESQEEISDLTTINDEMYRQNVQLRTAVKSFTGVHLGGPAARASATPTASLDPEEAAGAAVLDSPRRREIGPPAVDGSLAMDTAGA